MERVIGASPFVGGERGSSSTAREFRMMDGAGKKDRGNSKTRGEKRAGVGGTSDSGSDEWLRVNVLWRGLLVISVMRGDMRAFQSSSSGSSCLRSM